MIETISTLTCVCGFMTAGFDHNAVQEEFEGHSAGRLGHAVAIEAAVSNPCVFFPGVRARMRRQAEEWRALQFIERYRDVEIELEREENGLAFFVGVHNAFKIVAAAAILGFGIYGIWIWR